jgi:thioredoxin 1
MRVLIIDHIFMASVITKDTFKQEVLDKKGLVFVDFYAEWCGPCKVTDPIIEELSKEVKDVHFVKVDVDNDSELAGQYNVSSIPSFFIFKDGQVVNQAIGAMGKEGFEAMISKAKS